MSAIILPYSVFEMQHHIFESVEDKSILSNIFIQMPNQSKVHITLLLKSHNEDTTEPESKKQKVNRD